MGDANPSARFILAGRNGDGEDDSKDLVERSRCDCFELSEVAVQLPFMEDLDRMVSIFVLARNLVP